MKIHEIPYEEIQIPKNRQRREFNEEAILALAGSIASNGLIQPIVVRNDEDSNTILVAGERRLRALQYIWNLGEEVRCGDYLFPEGLVPCISQGEMDPTDAFEMELEENVRRTDLTWQESAAATSRLLELRKVQATAAGKSEPTMAEFVEETGHAAKTVHRDLILARALGDEDVAKAKTPNEAIKILERKEAAAKSEAFAIEVGKTFSAKDHRLFQGNCLEVMLEALPEFDVILTDPPYGIDAQDFGDSGGRAAGGHSYDDTYSNWLAIMPAFCKRIYTLAKPQAHAYIFCDIDRFLELRRYMELADWKVFRTPIIWFNPGGFRAPWPDQGPQRKWQMILYAVKGDKHVTSMRPDLITYHNDENLGHHAQKPVEVYRDLLLRSARAGDSVIDPFCGSGTIFPAAHELKIKATGIELDVSNYGLAAKRLGELK